MSYRILNWDKYQSRTDRVSSPWVKLHKDLLHSADFYSIPEKRRWEWPLLLLMSKHHDGVIEGTDTDIGFILYKTLDKPFDAKPFIGRLLSPHTPQDQEIEKEQEKEQEQEQEADTSGIQSVSSGNHRSPEVTSPVNIEPVGVFPTKDVEWPLMPEFLAALESTYENGRTDWVFNECKAAKMWLLANKDNLKTYKGMPRFLNGWMKRASDSNSKLTSLERMNLKATKQDALQGAKRERESQHRTGETNGKPEPVSGSMGGVVG